MSGIAVFKSSFWLFESRMKRETGDYIELSDMFVLDVPDELNGLILLFYVPSPSLIDQRAKLTVTAIVAGRQFAPLGHKSIELSAVPGRVYLANVTLSISAWDDDP